MRQYKNQRNQQNNLPEAGDKKGCLCFSKGCKCLLDRHLDAEHAENGHVNPKCPTSCRNNFFRIAEYADEGCWRQLDKQPENGQCCHRNSKHAFKRLSDSFGVAGTVIVADDRRGTFCDGVNRRFDHLTDTGDDGHNGYVDITACNGQDIVGADSDKTVGQLHDKSGRPQADDISGMSGALRNLIYMKPSYL